MPAVWLQLVAMCAAALCATAAVPAGGDVSLARRAGATPVSDNAVAAPAPDAAAVVLAGTAVVLAAPPDTSVRLACIGALRPASQFAYVMMHYEGTQKDPEYVLGTRVLIKSIQASGTAADLVVLASTSVSEASIRAFCDDGAIVQIVEDIPNPFKDSVKPRFLNALNKLHLWRMTRYTRVIYLDSDNIVTNNMDELFGCGSFCVVFMNPCHFHTGLVVVKPDLREYERLIATLNNGGQSYDGADQGFLSHVYGKQLMLAPLFVQNRSAASHPDDVMRLPIGYNMHFLYMYETMSWDMFRVQGFKDLPMPFLSVTFPITPPLKPWNWLPYALFDMHWEWLKHRHTLNESHLAAVVTRFMLIPLASFCVVLLAQVVIKSKSATQRVVGVTDALVKHVGLARLSWTVGYSSVLISIWVSMKLVPQLLPPLFGWGLFLLFINGAVLTILRLVHLVAEVSSPILPSTSPTAATAPHSPPSVLETLLPLMAVPVAVQFLAALLLFTDVQLFVVNNFVEKMLCVIGTLAAVVFTLARSVKWYLSGTLAAAYSQGAATKAP